MKTIKIAANVSYTALVLDNPNDILNRFQVPDGWEKIAHHVTMNMGPSENPELIGKKFTITVIGVSKDDKVMAAKVVMPEGVPTINSTPHITIAVNRAGGGKPVMSNSLTNWEDIHHFTISGTVTEVAR